MENQTDNEDSWSVLMSLAQGGDAIAYKRLLKAIRGVLMSYLKGRVSNAVDAEDLVQEVLIAVHKARHTYEVSKPFGPWVFAIARHKLIDHYRKWSRIGKNDVQQDELLDYLQDPRDLYASLDQLAWIDSVLATLPERQERIVRMIKVEGHSLADVAEEMNSTEAAIKVTAHRAYKLLRQHRAEI